MWENIDCSVVRWEVYVGRKRESESEHMLRVCAGLRLYRNAGSGSQSPLLVHFFSSSRQFKSKCYNPTVTDFFFTYGAPWKLCYQNSTNYIDRPVKLNLTLLKPVKAHLVLHNIYDFFFKCSVSTCSVFVFLQLNRNVIACYYYIMTAFTIQNRKKNKTKKQFETRKLQLLGTHMCFWQYREAAV